MDKKGIVVKNKKEDWVSEFMFLLLVKETYKVSLFNFNFSKAKFD